MFTNKRLQQKNGAASFRRLLGSPLSDGLSDNAEVNWKGHTHTDRLASATTGRKARFLDVLTRIPFEVGVITPYYVYRSRIEGTISIDRHRVDHAS